MLTYIALGSNLNNPIEQVQKALTALHKITKTQLLRHSHLYHSKPLGPQDQPDFINAVALLETQLTPMELLNALLEIERQQGRIRTHERWGPRILDLDIILYGDEILNTPELHLPHPGLPIRNFWVYPLLEIAPDLILPDGTQLKTLVQQCSSEGLEKITEN